MNWYEVEGYFDIEQQLEYERLARLIPDGSLLVEVGSFRGRSLASIAETIKLKKLKVLSVDIFGSHDYGEPDVDAKKANMLEDFKANMRAFGLDQIVETFVGGSVDGASKARESGWKPMLVFIDADHTYDAVRKDLEAWSPLLGPGAVFCGHDYGTPWPGVKNAVDEKFPAATIRTQIWSVVL